MDSNSIKILSIRETTFGKISDEMSIEERFQNATLRPILKFQNEKILHLFKNYLEKRKIAFHKLNIDEKIKIIENSVRKDKQLEILMKGLIIGLFTIEELEIFVQNSNALNKRIVSMLIERLQSQIQLFE